MYVRLKINSSYNDIFKAIRSEDLQFGTKVTYELNLTHETFDINKKLCDACKIYRKIIEYYK